MIEPARPTRFEKKKNMRINFAEETRFLWQTCSSTAFHVSISDVRMDFESAFRRWSPER